MVLFPFLFHYLNLHPYSASTELVNQPFYGGSCLQISFHSALCSDTDARPSDFVNSI